MAVSPWLIFRDFKDPANFSTRSNNSLYDIFFFSFAIGPSYIKAILSGLFLTCLSKQLYVILVIPSEYHLYKGELVSSRILVGYLNHSILFDYYYQNYTLSFIDLLCNYS